MGFVNNGLAANGASFGNMRAVCGVLTASNGAGVAVATGLDVIAGLTITPKSCTTNGGIEFAISGGNITPATCASGDDYYLTAWGK